MEKFGNGTYYLEDGNYFLIPLWYCRSCDCFVRECNDKLIFSHLKAASYTNIENEKQIYNQRINYFKYLYFLVRRQKTNISNWLDFGCSYGHLIEFLIKKRIEGYGIEMNDDLKKYARDKGLIVYEKLDCLPKENH